MPDPTEVPTRAARYRIKAKEAIEQAERSLDPETKRKFEEVARLWLNLAAGADRTD
jgi:hypothetical protein